MNNKIYPCFLCLKDIEEIIKKNDWKKIKKPLYYWYEMCSSEKIEIEKIIKEIKPRDVLELGFGSGRIINILLKNKVVKNIYGVEKDKKMFGLTKPLFLKDKNIHLFNKDINNFLNDCRNFDLVLATMNTFGNIDDINVIKKIVEKTKHLVFTVYDKKYYKLRKEIYKLKGHKNFCLKNKIYYFNDRWVRGLKSKSYTKNEIENICKILNKKYKIKKISKLLWFIHVYE